MQRISIGKAAKLLSVHPDTLRKWEQQGFLRSVRTLGGHRRYLLTDIETLLTSDEEEARCNQQKSN